MKRTMAIYGAAMAAGAFLLQWLENQYTLQLFSTEIYIVLLAVLFTAVGIWIGSRLHNRPAATEFTPNEKAAAALGLTDREIDVLRLLAEGGSNDDIAKCLFVSTSTVKTHLVHLYQKLNVARRTQAVQKARSLQIIP
ncbi:MAG: response regulator transcription factor [Woeseiaceae bacterium]